MASGLRIGLLGHGSVGRTGPTVCHVGSDTRNYVADQWIGDQCIGRHADGAERYIHFQRFTGREATLARRYWIGVISSAPVGLLDRSRDAGGRAGAGDALASGLAIGADCLSWAIERR